MHRLVALFFAALIALTGAVSAEPAPALPGNSLLNTSSMNGLRTSLAMSILANEKQLGSPESTIVSANVVRKPATGNLLLATWSEAWVVQRKNKQVTYTVEFDGGGSVRGISYKLSLK
ncbi:MAG: hypothetical protein JSR82_15980 [Verrucomicrobia bacterium]|nr:hypothetical protein [Verrucomicrobiota bacterium]